MAQVSMTVRMDSQLKQNFDALCSRMGMSVNAAINIFANAVVRTRSIPFNSRIWLLPATGQSSHWMKSTKKYDWHVRKGLHGKLSMGLVPAIHNDD